MYLTQVYNQNSPMNYQPSESGFENEEELVARVTPTFSKHNTQSLHLTIGLQVLLQNEKTNCTLGIGTWTEWKVPGRRALCKSCGDDMLPNASPSEVQALD